MHYLWDFVRSISSFFSSLCVHQRSYFLFLLTHSHHSPQVWSFVANAYNSREFRRWKLDVAREWFFVYGIISTVISWNAFSECVHTILNFFLSLLRKIHLLSFVSLTASPWLSCTLVNRQVKYKKLTLCVCQLYSHSPWTLEAIGTGRGIFESFPIKGKTPWIILTP